MDFKITDVSPRKRGRIVELMSRAERAITVSSTLPGVVDDRTNGGWKNTGNRIECVCVSLILQAPQRNNEVKG